MILTIAIIGSLQLASLNRLANGTCNAQVYTYTSTSKELGYIRPYSDKRKIYVAKSPVREARATVFHECCHLLNPDWSEGQCEAYALMKTGR